MARYTFKQCASLGWLESPDNLNDRYDFPDVGVAIRRSDGYYTYEPASLNESLRLAIQRLRANVVISISSEISTAIFRTPSASATYLTSPSSTLRIPILHSLDDVGYNRGIESNSPIAYLLRREQLLLVTATAVEAILHNGRAVEAMILGLIWGGEVPTLSSRHLSRHNSIFSEGSNPQPLTPGVPGEIDEKHEVYIRAMRFEDGYESADEEMAAAPARPVPLTHAVVVCLATILVVVVVGLRVSTILNEWSWDGRTLRFVLIGFPTIFPFVFLSLFFFVVVVNCIFQLTMPISIVLKNTKFLSAIKPKIQRHRDYELPHITIQMPVYKEGLKGVIVPTIVSLLAAIEDYESRGGTASIYVNDDGMQLVEPDLAEARKHYYQTHGIGYCARPPNKKDPPKRPFWKFWARKSEDNIEAPNVSPPQALANAIGFVRKGKFKKASNMNYALDFSCRVEDELQRLTAEYLISNGCTDEDLTAEEDEELYQQALANMLTSDNGRTWAAGNVRIGELILIIDCDTRVPKDCLIMGALEMHESPEVSILQHGSGVMQIVHNPFENGIAFFTNIVYTSIQYAVGTGDVAPFVGHNAFLRWKAVQSISFVDPSDGLRKWWSDAHVSEDFDISLRLQMAGNICRLATYHNGGFKEGVSLTIFDELARWEKYAYGCNELLFNPLHTWWYKGPITRLFLRFLWSNMPVTSKFTIVAYITSYYSVAAGFPLTLINYIIFGLFPEGFIDHSYLPSWTIFVSLLVIFDGLSLISFALLCHRTREKQFLPALLESIMWLPFFFLFFGGISIHVGKALLCHLFGINIEWSSTAKELGPTGFYIQLEKITQGFKWVFGMVLVISAGMIYFANFAPWGYSITDWTLIVPLTVQLGSHFLLPIALGLV